jgi:hypothetical protein
VPVSADTGTQAWIWLGPVGGGGGWEGGLNKNTKNIILRMRFSIAENVRTPCDIIFIISRASQLPYNKKTKK